MCAEGCGPIIGSMRAIALALMLWAPQDKRRR
jgi:hypothetical protein